MFKPPTGRLAVMSGLMRFSETSQTEFEGDSFQWGFNLSGAASAEARGRGTTPEAGARRETGSRGSELIEAEF